MNALADMGDGVLINTVSGPTNCPSGDCTTTTPISSYTVSKTSDPASGETVQPGDEITYEVTVVNTGRTDLVDLAIVVEYSVTVKAASDLGDGVLRNGLTSPNSDCTGDPGSDPDSCSTVKPISAWTATKAVLPGGVVDPGEDVTYTITVMNTGGVDLAGLAVTDDLTEVPDDDVTVGDTVRYRITATNRTAVAVTDEVIVDDLSGVLDDATFDGVTQADAGAVDYVEPVLTWTTDLEAGESATLTYAVTVTGGGDDELVNTVVGGVNCPPGSDDTPCAVRTAILADDGASGGSGDDVTPSDSGGRLPVTGSDLAILVLVGLSAVAAGAWLTLRTRRTARMAGARHLADG